MSSSSSTGSITNESKGQEDSFRPDDLLQYNTTTAALSHEQDEEEDVKPSLPRSLYAVVRQQVWSNYGEDPGNGGCVINVHSSKRDAYIEAIEEGFNIWKEILCVKNDNDEVWFIDEPEIRDRCLDGLAAEFVDSYLEGQELDREDIPFYAMSTGELIRLLAYFTECAIEKTVPFNVENKRFDTYDYIEVQQIHPY